MPQQSLLPASDFRMHPNLRCGICTGVIRGAGTARIGVGLLAVELSGAQAAQEALAL